MRTLLVGNGRVTVRQREGIWLGVSLFEAEQTWEKLPPMQLGKYQLIRRLAAGGMAEVYLARAAGPMGFEKQLVVKRILPHLAEDQAFVQMFLTEAKLAARLNHPHIVQIFDFGEAEGSYFLAMEHVDGHSLRWWVKRAANRALPAVLCAKVVAEAAEGLAAAHDLRDPVSGEHLMLIHRDVSPDNILVSRLGVVKVVDFGIAKVAGQEHRTDTGVVKGKLVYMPPEQLQARPLDRRVDVYGLGMVLYELLTGHRPFEATTEVGTMHAILYQPFVPAARWRPDLPVALQQVLDKALAKDRGQRYPDCRALQRDLERFILSTGEPVSGYEIARLVEELEAEDVGGPWRMSPPAGTPVHTPAAWSPDSGSQPDYVPGNAPGPDATVMDAALVEHPTVLSSSTSEITLPQRPVRSSGPKPALESPAVARGDSAATAARDGTDTTVRIDRAQRPPGKAEPELEHLEGEVLAVRRRPDLFVPVVVGLALLVSGGGYILNSRGSPKSVQQETRVAMLAQPSSSTPRGPGMAATADPVAEEAAVKAEETASTANVPVTSTSMVHPSTEPPVPDSSPLESPAAKAVAPGVKGSKTRTSSRSTEARARSGSAPVDGMLELHVKPSGTAVFYGDRKIGTAPLKPARWPAGEYTLKFMHKSLPLAVEAKVEVKPGATMVYEFDMANFVGGAGKK